MKRLLALIAALALLLCGCGAKNALGFSRVVRFDDMEYTRPDMDTVAEQCQAALDAAEQAESVDAVLEAVWAYYDTYDDFVTNYNLAYIHYQTDLKDFYWKTEYDYCAEKYPQLEAYLEDLYYALADSSLRSELEAEYFGEGWFEDYDGQSIYDEELVALLEQEQTLVGEYYNLSAQAQELEYYSEAYFDAYTMPMAEVLAELIGVRQTIAQRAGYDSYTDFAWDYYHYRDYTPAQAEAYLDEIRRELVPLYRMVNQGDHHVPGEEYCSEGEIFAYVEKSAKELGGQVWEAFRLLDAGELYNIAPSPRKSGVSFEVYLSGYYQPYVFVSGSGTRYDCLTFAHEFGHFAMDYAAAGTGAGTDVCEIFSQGMEYLSLIYGGAEEDLTRMKLADSLCIYVEQAAYAAFEQQMYRLTGGELTAENLLALYDRVCRDYGFDSADWDPRDLITVPHFYGNPVYIISYVVSNDAAMQLYELELAQPGGGRNVFEENLATEEGWFLAFLDQAGLHSPFGRVAQVKKLMETYLS